MPTDDELMQIARESAKEKVGFYTHFAAYVAVNLFLIALWWTTSGPGSFPWFIFVLVFWGIGVVAHGIGTFAGGRYSDKMAEREYQRLKEKR